MGLLNFLFGIGKQAKANAQQGKSHAYNQGYNDGRRDSYEEYACECEDGVGDCQYDYNHGGTSEYYDCECGCGDHDCCCEDSGEEEWQ